jgi:hypothetical protein
MKEFCVLLPLGDGVDGQVWMGGVEGQSSSIQGIHNNRRRPPARPPAGHDAMLPPPRRRGAVKLTH